MVALVKKGLLQAKALWLSCEYEWQVRRKIFLTLLLLACLSAVQGCTILESTRINLTDAPTIDDARQDKIAYFLPTGRLRLQNGCPGENRRMSNDRFRSLRS